MGNSGYFSGHGGNHPGRKTHPTMQGPFLSSVVLRRQGDDQRTKPTVWDFPGTGPTSEKNPGFIIPKETKSG